MIFQFFVGFLYLASSRPTVCLFHLLSAREGRPLWTVSRGPRCAGERGGVFNPHPHPQCTVHTPASGLSYCSCLGTCNLALPICAPCASGLVLVEGTAPPPLLSLSLAYPLNYPFVNRLSLPQFECASVPHRGPDLTDGNAVSSLAYSTTKADTQNSPCLLYFSRQGAESFHISLELELQSSNPCSCIYQLYDFGKIISSL